MLAWNEHFCRHPSNHRLATMTVYATDRTPERTRDEILERIAGMYEDRP
jgi:hypothetical protein